MKEIIYIKNGKRFKISALVDKDTNIIYYEVGNSDNKMICSVEYWSDNFDREPEPEALGFWENRHRCKELAAMDNKPYEEVHGSY